MNKQDLIEFVATEANLSKADASKAVNAVMKGIISGLKKKVNVMLVGFGTFAVVKRKARMARNPRTGEEMKIPAKLAVVFRVGQALKDLINKK